MNNKIKQVIVKPDKTQQTKQKEEETHIYNKYVIMFFVTEHNKHTYKNNGKQKT